MQRYIENWEAITGGSPEKGYAFESWQFIKYPRMERGSIIVSINSIQLTRFKSSWQVCQKDNNYALMALMLLDILVLVLSYTCAYFSINL
jgi:hypothetical protein